jgi:hypothetical protein
MALAARSYAEGRAASWKDGCLDALATSQVTFDVLNSLTITTQDTYEVIY